MKKLFLLGVLFLCSSCINTKSTIKNIDDTANKPLVKNKAFIFTENAESSKYGYDADYPINIGLILEQQEDLYIGYFFNGLLGSDGEKINYKKVDTCCPFPTKRNVMGAGTLSVYEVTSEGNTTTKTLYFNVYEKGKVMCPKGFTIKPNN